MRFLTLSLFSIFLAFLSSCGGTSTTSDFDAGNNTIDNCHTVLPENANVCKTCSSGYIRNGHGTCSKATTQCQRYAVYSSTERTGLCPGTPTAENNFKGPEALDANCKSQDSYCSEIGTNKTYCSECAQNYALNICSGKCTESASPLEIDNCIAYLSTFSGHSKCYACKDGYVPSADNTTCVGPCQPGFIRFYGELTEECTSTSTLQQKNDILDAQYCQVWTKAASPNEFGFCSLCSSGYTLQTDAATSLQTCQKTPMPLAEMPDCDDAGSLPDIYTGECIKEAGLGLANCLAHEMSQWDRTYSVYSCTECNSGYVSKTNHNGTISSAYKRNVCRLEGTTITNCPSWGTNTSSGQATSCNSCNYSYIPNLTYGTCVGSVNNPHCAMVEVKNGTQYWCQRCNSNYTVNPNTGICEETTS